MPGLPPSAPNELETLLGFLAQQRDALRIAAFGLDEDGARATPTPSSLSVGGLIKHVTAVERFWMTIVTGEVDTSGFDASTSATDYEQGFRLGAEETIAGALADYEAAAEATDDTIRRAGDLGRAVAVPPGVPWFPEDVTAWDVRWIVLHLIEETARHAGHADIVREGVDGATAMPLMAAAEQWPATPWLTPWEPAA